MTRPEAPPGWEWVVWSSMPRADDQMVLLDAMGAGVVQTFIKFGGQSFYNEEVLLPADPVERARFMQSLPAAAKAARALSYDYTYGDYGEYGSPERDDE